VDERTIIERKKILFLSSDYVNCARFFAQIFKKGDIFLILDRKLPFEIFDLDNFYVYNFDKGKYFDTDKTKFFDLLSVYIDEFCPDIIILDNFYKFLPDNFIEFLNFRNSNIKILTLYHSNDLTNLNVNSFVNDFLKQDSFLTNICSILKDNSLQILEKSYSTTIKELKQKKILLKREDILNLKTRKIVMSYHERTKVVKLLVRICESLLFK